MKPLPALPKVDIPPHSAPEISQAEVGGVAGGEVSNAEGIENGATMSDITKQIDAVEEFEEGAEVRSVEEQFDDNGKKALERRGAKLERHKSDDCDEANVNK
jgi:hypothetical protein